MESAEILVDGKSIAESLKYRLFVFETADTSGIERLFVSRTANGVKVLAGGEGENIKTFYDDLLEGMKEYEIDRISEPQPYSGDIQTLESYVKYLQLAEIVKFNEYLSNFEKGVLKIEETTESINQKLQRFDESLKNTKAIEK